MIEVREIDTARAMLRTTVFARVKQEEPDRYLRLEHLSGRTYFDIRRALPPARRPCALAAGPCVTPAAGLLCGALLPCSSQHSGVAGTACASRMAATAGPL